ncbi:hypothetical protein SDC9_55875 [bioreactor metagenome]|uniref:ABC transporter domain-containing protein n=1 Tax=bioreactor metagenome TaxID=1076179 RepID=A0A644X5W3_9ZZZZ
MDRLNLSADEGELFSLLGVNGAGKTTTIKMLSCLTKPTDGDAVLLGDSILKHPLAVKGKINVSPQETSVAPNLTAKENLELIARIYGYDKKEVKEKNDFGILPFGGGRTQGTDPVRRMAEAAEHRHGAHHEAKDSFS